MAATAKTLTNQYAALAAIDYPFYVEYTHGGLYRHGRHTELVAKRLQEIEEDHRLRKKGARIIITMPPRHSKSMTITETFPSYFIGKDPSRRVIEVSYGDDLARKFGRANLQKVKQYGAEIFGISVARDRNSVTDWDLAGHRGGMISRGLGGGITGQGADLLIIDDPIKNRREANSQTNRKFIKNEWQATIATRLQPNAVVIVILTRWHEDDLAGWLLQNDKEKQWELLNLPAIAEDEDDPLGREIGEPLWPEVGYDEEWAKQKEKDVGSTDWAALYQQRPSPPEGQIFKRSYWKYYKQPPARFNEIIQSWDATFKDLETSDFVVGQVWGRAGAEFYLLDQIRGKMGIAATMSAIRNLTAKWPKAYAKLIEDKANGTAVIELLKKEISGLIPVNPQGGKEVRAAAIKPLLEAGNVFLPDPTIAPWVNDLVEEAAAFPNGKNDDQVDCATQALVRLNNKPNGPLIARA
jgi:predicted phage terminase large subunit-like protein